MTSRNMAEVSVSAIAVDEDTIRYGGSAFKRESMCSANVSTEHVDARLDIFHCKRCDFACWLDDGRDDKTKPKYCPNCGSKVVEVIFE